MKTTFTNTRSLVITNDEGKVVAIIGNVGAGSTDISDRVALAIKEDLSAESVETPDVILTEFEILDNEDGYSFEVTVIDEDGDEDTVDFTLNFVTIYF